MQFIETSTLTAYGVDWDFVRTALGGGQDLGEGLVSPAGYANIGKDWRKWVAEMLRVNDMDPNLVDQALLSATNPGFGAEREVDYVDGAKVFGVEDPMGGMWRIILPGQFTWARWISSDGSAITVDADEQDGWTVTGSFPIEDGERWEGGYFESMMRAVDQANAEGAAQRAADRLEQIRSIILDRYRSRIHDAIDGPEDGMNFHNWDIVGGGYLPESQEEIDEARRAIEAVGLTPDVRLASAENGLEDIAGYRTDGPIWVLGAVTPAGFERELRDEAAQIIARYPDRKPIELVEFLPLILAYPQEG